MITEFDINVVANLKQLQCDRLRIICNRFGFSEEEKLMCNILVEAYRNDKILSREIAELTYTGEANPKQVIVQTALSMFSDEDGAPLALLEILGTNTEE